MPRPAIVLLSLVLAVATALPVRADDQTPAERAAQEIMDARAEANRATDAYFTAESHIDQLDVQAQQLEGEVAELQTRFDALHELITDVAINRYIRSGTVGLPVLSGFTNPRDQVQIDALISVADQSSIETLDLYDSTRLALDQRRSALERTRADAQRERDQLAGLRDAATARVEQLKAMEEQRLKDEAIRKAVEQKKAEEARLAEQNRQRQETARAPQRTLPEADDRDGETPALSVPPSAARGDATTTTTGPSPAGSSEAASTATSAAPTTAPRPAIDPGGQTGGGGAPGAGISAVYGALGWVCPTGNAAVGFGDTWGAPRSGGRRHQGVDMIGARGTPILAVVDGVASARSNTLGGTTIWFSGSDGNRYYYAHLDNYGQLGAVTAGTVIGYMGDTGNAKESVVHLHFEIHPGGGSAVNPYPTVRARC